MDIINILSKVDHTLLSQDAAHAGIIKLCGEASEYNIASVCVPPSYVKTASDYLKGRTAVCTVIGFPNGYSTTPVKVFETQTAIYDGANEIDMVINIGALKDRRYDFILNEIRSVKTVCGDHILKVIIETCFLTEEEKIKMCGIISESGADFIKTSTGFGKAGASREDIKLFSSHIGKNVRIKAAGGIRTLQDAEDYIKLGCSRIGSSSIIKALREAQ